MIKVQPKRTARRFPPTHDTKPPRTVPANKDTTSVYATARLNLLRAQTQAFQQKS